MDLKAILAQLEALGDEAVRKLAVRSGAGRNQYGVPLGDVRALANKLKSGHDLAGC